MKQSDISSKQGLIIFNAFKENAVLNMQHKSQNSVYYNCKYNGISFKFCVSDHHSKYRGSMITVISKSMKQNDILRIAYDIYNYKKQINTEESIKQLLK